jgi:hypothetical protein
MYHNIQKHFLHFTILILFISSCSKNEPNLPSEISTPTIETIPPNNVTNTSASSGVTVISDGGAKITEKGVCWSKSVNPTIADNKSMGNSNSYPLYMLTDLTANIEYYVRAYAINSIGVSYGKSYRFITEKDISSFNSQIHKIAFDKTGNLYVQGGFTNDIGKFYMAKWDGNVLNKLGISDYNIYNLLIDNYNNVYTLSSTSTNINLNIPYLSILNNNSWSKLGVLDAKFSACLAIDFANNIYANCVFNNNLGYYSVVKWNGNTWSNIGPFGNKSPISSITTDKLGNVYVAMKTNNGSDKYGTIWKWNGLTWSQIIDLEKFYPDPDIRSLICDSSNNLFVAGTWRQSASNNANNRGLVAKWDGSAWFRIDLPKYEDIADVLMFDNIGNLYAGGSIKNSNGKNYIAKWNGVGWDELGSGFSDLNDNTGLILTLAIDASNNVYAAGSFQNRMGNGYYPILKWSKNTNTWGKL